MNPEHSPLRGQKALAFRPSLWRRANVLNINFETLYNIQFTLSTQLIILNYRCYTLPSTQHHRFFRNLPPLLREAVIVLKLNIYFVEWSLRPWSTLGKMYKKTVWRKRIPGGRVERLKFFKSRGSYSGLTPLVLGAMFSKNTKQKKSVYTD